MSIYVGKPLQGEVTIDTQQDHGPSARSSCSTRGSRNGMEFYLKSLEGLFPSSTWVRWVACQAEQKAPKNKLRVQKPNYSQERKYHDKSR